MKRALIFSLFLASTAQAAETRLSVGDWVNGKKLYVKECAACHGEDGKGGRIGIALTNSDRLNLITSESMFAMVRDGTGTKKPKEHQFGDKLGFLETWDVIAHVRTLHMTLDEFFPDSSRYVMKRYTIDDFGLERI
jgi:mono/diheme cytochrome c family protein